MERTEQKILENVRLVHYVLQKQLHFPITHMEYEDLYQEGVIGLILAIDRFDESKNYQFATFAVPYIRGTIQRYKRDFTLPVHCSREIKDTIFKVSKHMNEGLSTEEIEKIESISHSDMHDALCVLGIRSFQQTLVDDITLGDMVPCNESCDEFIHEDFLVCCIQKVSKKIKNAKFRSMWLDFIYNAMQGEVIKQKTLGEKYGMTQAHVSRTLKRYNEQLKELLEQG